MAEIDPRFPLKDPRQEAFAQHLASAMTPAAAYEKAGYSPDHKNAKKAAAKPHIQARMAYLLQPALERAGIERDRVMREFAALAFSDITKAMSWRNDIRREEDYADGGEVLVVREIVSHKARFVDSDQLDEATRAAIASVEVTLEGAIKVKMHPKIPALVKLAELLRMLAPPETPAGGDQPGPTLIQNVFNMTPQEATDQVMAAFRSARAHAEPIEPIDQAGDGGAAALAQSVD